MNIIKRVKPLPNFQIELTYSDGEAILVDFKPVIAQGGVFSRLSDPDLFNQVKAGGDGRYIEWPNGVDFCADALRRQAEQKV
ncbi:MAG: DUF2442 domain-containing protein [Nitrospinae bacterium]|nr:DUF2442 domain-containing protein [Nitrospinota bacterium]